MDAIISSLLNRFERGALTRRELIQGLTMLTAAAGGASQAQGPAPDSRRRRDPPRQRDRVSFRFRRIPPAIQNR